MNTTSARLALAEFMKTRSTSCKHAPQGHELLCMELRIGGDTPHTYLPAGDHHPFLRELSEFLFYEFQAEAERS